MAWNRSTSETSVKQSAKRKGFRFSTLGVGVGVVAVLGVAAVFLFRSEPQDAETHKRQSSGRIKEVTPAPAPKVQEVVETPKEPKKPAKKKVPRPAFANKPFAQMTSGEKAQMMRYWLSDTNNVIKGIDMRTRVPPPMFEHHVMNAILPYFEPGADVVETGPIRDEDARKAIDAGVEFNFDDPEDVLLQKQFVKETLADLKKYMDEGGHATQFFENLWYRQQTEHTAVMSCREEVLKLRNEGRIEEAQETMDAFNKYLEGKGLPKMHMNLNKGIRRNHE